MTWTTDKPTTPGWYWWRSHPYKSGEHIIRVLDVLQVGHNLWAKGIGEITDLSCSWSSTAIEPPKEEP